MSKVEEFMAQLDKSIPAARNFSSEKLRAVEKISLNFSGNEGRYQILPLTNAITNFPYVVLTKTREICIPRKNVSADGTEKEYEAWIKLLPENGYLMKDSDGRVVSSLTSEETSVMKQANELFDQLFQETDARNNPEILKSLCRIRNYTIFHAHCLRYWNFQDSRKEARSNFAGLFVTTAKGFLKTVQDDIEEKSLMKGGDKSWLTDVYSDKLTGRTGYLMFSISRNKQSSPGYQVTVNHDVNPKMLEGVSISEEDAERMQDPVLSFLGWQAKRDDAPIGEKRLFNMNLYKDAISYMTQQLAAIRTAKATGANITDAIAATNNQVLSSSEATTTTGSALQDPMLASMSKPAEQLAVDTDRVVSNNTNPFKNPPAAHMDPVVSAPVNNGSQTNQASPFSGGSSFGSSFSNPFSTGSSNDDLPF